MARLYALDSTRVALREYAFGVTSPTTALILPLALLLKLLRVRVSGTSDDPPVESPAEFEVAPDQVSEDLRRTWAAPLAELQRLGFEEPVYHVMHLPHVHGRIGWVTLRHRGGAAVARLHQRRWTAGRVAKDTAWLSYLTPLDDGRFLVSTSGRPDLLSPPAVIEQRRVGAPAAELWAIHQAALQQPGAVRALAVRDGPGVRDLLAAHHAAVRDFHVGRGVFVPCEPPAAGATTAVAADDPDAAVLAEIDRQQRQGGSWGAAVLLLALSLGFFVLLGAAHWEWEFVLLLLPVLALHELGHFVAMRLFGYRNVRMFFIPLLGAAVTGRSHNVPGWQKALVSLAGPLPGILLAAPLGVAAVALRQPWLLMLAYLMVFINAFNLLPFMPLDGGWVVRSVLFCRHPLLDTAFRVFGLAGLALLALALNEYFLLGLAVFLALGVPAAHALARVAHELRRDGYGILQTADDQSIPLALARDIIARVRRAQPRAGALVVARSTLNVYETINTPPPPALVAVGLLAVHAAGFLAAAVVAVVLVAAGSLGPVALQGP